jgi:DNA-binding HxlR family transcriptional regulator
MLWHTSSVPVARRNQVAKKGAAPARRSPCPVVCSLDIFGDRWTLLIVRDLFFGRARFKDFTASPEGIPTNILAERLERLLAHGLVEQIPAEDGTKRLAYRLTEKGEALRPVLKAMRDWGLAWDKSTRVMA